MADPCGCFPRYHWGVGSHTAFWNDAGISNEGHACNCPNNPQVIARKKQADRPEIEEARRRRAELIISDVDAAQAEGHISAFQNEARGVAREFLDLLGKQSEREAGLRLMLQRVGYSNEAIDYRLAQILSGHETGILAEAKALLAEDRGAKPSDKRGVTPAPDREQAKLTDAIRPGLAGASPRENPAAPLPEQSEEPTTETEQERET